MPSIDGLTRGLLMSYYTNYATVTHRKIIVKNSFMIPTIGRHRSQYMIRKREKTRDIHKTGTIGPALHHRASTPLTLLQIRHVFAVSRICKIARFALQALYFDILGALTVPPSEPVYFRGVEFLIVNSPLTVTGYYGRIRVWKMEVGQINLRGCMFLRS